MKIAQSILLATILCLSGIFIVLLFTKQPNDDAISEDNKQLAETISPTARGAENLSVISGMLPQLDSETQITSDIDLTEHQSVIAERSPANVVPLAATSQETTPSNNQVEPPKSIVRSFSSLEENPSATPGTREHQQLVNEMIRKRVQRLKQ
ncbi:hypothetical protein [Roseibacillus persicicus]|uniref:Uncharacterized protein n=1 Tax=Roseibacillus persicicus TaxID=454148 RepID=A0A918TVE8_9BACT|nr:hypothetical protein [Roseibacillus persicicus]GHC65214.1 hypothetical protein GCM10007100_36180 [Roseibacillus persicicus]